MNDSELTSHIHAFWFGKLDADGMADPNRNKLWFQSTPADDRNLSEAFGSDVRRAVTGTLDHLANTEDGLIALVLMLDQFTRSIYRDTPEAFSGDPKALMLAKAAVEQGIDMEIPTIHRVFLYIPFEHSEVLADQEMGVECFERLYDYCPPGAQKAVGSFKDYMVAHRDVIREFGRFPHRNAILGRDSSGAERSHLQVHGGF